MINANFNSVITCLKATSFNPLKIAGLLFWSKVQNLARTLWNTAGFQLNNEGSAPDLKLFSGRGIDFDSANDDYVSIPNLVLTAGVYTIIGYMPAGVSNRFMIGSSSNNSFFLDTNFAALQLNGSSDRYVWSFPGGDLTNTQTYHVAIIVNGSTADLYINGAKQTQDANSGNPETIDLTISQISSSNSDGVFSGILLFNSILSEDRILDYCNNPNSLIEYAQADGAERAYPLMEGYYPNGGVVLDYSGNEQHGAFSSVAAGSYDASVNDIDFGYQSGLSGLSTYDINESGNGYVDLGSNVTITNGEYIEVKLLHLKHPDVQRRLIDGGSPSAYFFRVEQTSKIQVRANFGTVFNSSDSLNLNEINIVRITRNASDLTITINGTDESFARNEDFPIDQIFTDIAGTGYNCGILLEVDVNGTVYRNKEKWNGLTKTGIPEFIQVFPTTPKGVVDLLASTIEAWKDGKINLSGGRNGGLQLASALGNVRTFAFAIKVPDASVNQSIWELGTPADITINSSAIVCSAFSSIVVDGSGNSITDDTWHYVELQNATDVNIDQISKLLVENFDGEIIPLIAYSGQITSQESDKLRTYVNSIT